MRNAVQTVPDADPLVKLGQLLFFSQTLAANYDVSCGTCHHPDFGGSDGLSLSIGVAPRDASAVGPDRVIDPARDLDPNTDGGPNMHRNSLTTFNVSLFDRALMYDGRAFVLDPDIVSGGHGQLIQTPESGQRADPEPLSGLLEFTVKGPIVNDNEMRGFAFTNYTTPSEYREHLIRRLRGDVDTQYNANPSAAAANWLERFRAAFDQPAAAAEDVITMLNVQRALAAYIGSKVFVDTPWRDFLSGGNTAISTDAKEGALLFLRSPGDGGLGCAGCHTDDRFADERFHNVGFPQLGRGFLHTEGTDLGRWMSTRTDEDRYAFRTPSLLNVATSAPYGHAGSFATLEETIRYHADPRSGVDTFDFSLLHLDQFRSAGITYPDAETHTRTAIAQPSFDIAEALLPARALSADEVRKLVAFLETLTDRCVADAECIGRWAPDRDDDPDGHTLIRDESNGVPPEVEAPRPEDYPELITLSMPATTARSTFPDTQACTNGLGVQDNTGEARFVRLDGSAIGLGGVHGYDAETWFTRTEWLEITMVGGGVTAAYLDDDCWGDLVFTGADVSGMRFFRNIEGSMFNAVDMLVGEHERQFTGAAIADLNGDYRRELLLGNIEATELPVFAQNSAGLYEKVAALPMTRPTYGISFAPLDATGYPYMFLAHWAAGNGTDNTAPALWKSDGAALRPWDTRANTSAATLNQRFNFTPKFADFTGDGLIDLVIASDFSTSATLRNIGSANAPHFTNETNYSVITDENGMGSALLDLDNDGNLEWFVTSVRQTAGEPKRNWGITGNRLYRNTSTASRISFEDITTEAGVRDGYWGWGACAEDFNNDGFIDLFHVNGFGHIPDSVVSTGYSAHSQSQYDEFTRTAFQDKPARLFINDGDGTFSEQALEWGIADPSEGRGLACFDSDRDGDIDIAVFDHSDELQFFENKIGSGLEQRFLNVRLVGNAPNTDAIGSSVHVTANVGAAGVQTQLRLAEANSNYNSQNLPDLHFGLGQAAVIDSLRVVWPNGSELTCENVAVNQFLVLDERDGEAACP